MTQFLNIYVQFMVSERHTSSPTTKIKLTCYCCEREHMPVT